MKKLSLYAFLFLMILLTSCSEEKEDASLKNLQKQFENLKKLENDKLRLKSIEETIKEIKTIGSTFNDMDSSYKKFSYCDGFMTSQINLYKKKDSEKNHVYKVVVGRMNGRQAFFKSQANIEEEEIMSKKNIKANSKQQIKLLNDGTQAWANGMRWAFLIINTDDKKITEKFSAELVFCDDLYKDRLADKI